MIAVQLFPAWRVVPQSHEGVKMLSQITAVFSVGVCVKSSGLAECQITRSDTVHVVSITHLAKGKLHLP